MTYLGSTEFYLRVSKGLVPGHSFYSKFGENPDVDTGTNPEDVWDYGGTYTYSSTADIDQVSSSNSGDTQDTVVEGLDTDWNFVSQEVTLTGQTPVTLTTPLLRVYRMYNNDITDYAGDIYVSINGASLTAGVPDTASDVRAQVVNGNNQTLMCIYTVPAGFTGFFTQGYVAMAKSSSNTAIFSWRARPFGGVFQVKSRLALIGTGSSTWQYAYTIPLPLPEKTDVIIRCEEVEANNTGVSGGFDVLLVDNNLLP